MNIENYSYELPEKMDSAINSHKFFHNPIVWFNSKEAAQYLRISVENFRVKVSRGQIPINGRLGRSWRFRRDALDQLLETSVQKEVP